jgi:hypothetical protein
VSTPEDSGLSEQANSFPANSREPTRSGTQSLDPNDPPWGLLQASLTWLASVVLLWLVPQLCALPYVAMHYRGMAGSTKEMLLSDRTFVLIVVAGFIPAHVLTLIIAWAVASRLGKISTTKVLGLRLKSALDIFVSALAAPLLFFIAMILTYNFGGQDTDLEKILRSSRAAALIVAFVATSTAPLVEEVIYRGLLYSALQRVAGPVLAVLVVTSMFAGLHVIQYWPNAGAITAISLLSLALTVVRARTGRLLPCYVIHLVFNGIQSIIIVAEPYLRSVY